MGGAAPPPPPKKRGRQRTMFFNTYDDYLAYVRRKAKLRHSRMKELQRMGMGMPARFLREIAPCGPKELRVAAWKAGLGVSREALKRVKSVMKRGSMAALAAIVANARARGSDTIEAVDVEAGVPIGQEAGAGSAPIG